MKKKEDYLGKSLKSCKRNPQEFAITSKEQTCGHRHQRTRDASQRYIKCIKQSDSRKFPKSQEGNAHSGIVNLQNTKHN
jgi:hypothetical protein